MQLFVLFLLYVFAELWLIVCVSQLTSISFTIGLMLVTGILGVEIARRQGLRNWVRINEQLNRGEMPGTEIREGLLIFAASVLLIVPGFLSDVVALCLLIPWIRRRASGRMTNWFRGRTFVQFRTFGPDGSSIYEHHGAPTEIIDAEFSHVPAEPRLLRGESQSSAD